MADTKKAWYRLDNAAKIYPAVRTHKWSGNFRVSVTLTEKIDIEVLKKALADTAERLVSLRLELHRGFFWYYFEDSGKPVNITDDVRNPCARFGGKHNREKPYRIRVYENRIALEIFHALTDGTGAMSILKTLTARYISLKYGVKIPAADGILNVNEKPSNEEMEDAFKHYAKFKTVKSRKELRGYHFKGTKLKPHDISIVTGIMSAEKVHAVSKSYGVTITEFITALMIYSFMQCQSESRTRIEKPVKISVPINLRKVYPSRTLRNFALYVNPGIEPRYGEFTLSEIIEDVHHFMKMNNREKYLNAIMCKNLSDEMNPFTRVVPLFIKNIVMRTAFNMYGENLVSSTFSNLGRVNVPDEMKQYIDRFDFVFGRFKRGMPSVAAASFGDNLCISWSSGIVEKDVERKFFTALVKMGIHVKIESNL